MNAKKVERLTKSIFEKWRKQEYFVRFVNGNTLDCRRENLETVLLTDALIDHIDDWKVDWDMDLTSTEVALVRDPAWRKIHLKNLTQKIAPKKF